MAKRRDRTNAAFQAAADEFGLAVQPWVSGRTPGRLNRSGSPRDPMKNPLLFGSIDEYPIHALQYSEGGGESGTWIITRCTLILPTAFPCPGGAMEAKMAGPFYDDPNPLLTLVNAAWILMGGRRPRPRNARLTMFSSPWIQLDDYDDKGRAVAARFKWPKESQPPQGTGEGLMTVERSARLRTALAHHFRLEVDDTKLTASHRGKVDDELVPLIESLIGFAKTLP